MSKMYTRRRGALADSIVISNELKTEIREMAQEIKSAKDGDTIKLQFSAEAASAVSQILEQIAKPGRVSLVRMDRALSTFEAASVLGVSRPFLIKEILDKDLIPYIRIGTRADRRIKPEDLMTFKHTRDAQRTQALNDLAQMNSEFIITDFELEEESDDSDAVED